MTFVQEGDNVFSILAPYIAAALVVVLCIALAFYVQHRKAVNIARKSAAGRIYYTAIAVFAGVIALSAFTSSFVAAKAQGEVHQILSGKILSVEANGTVLANQAAIIAALRDINSSIVAIRIQSRCKGLP